MREYPGLKHLNDREAKEIVKKEMGRRGISTSHPPDLEGGFKAGFLAQGMSDAEATKRARIAAEGH